MQFGWTDEQTRLHQRMRALGSDVAAVNPPERMRALAAAGALALPLPARHGGAEHDLVTTAYAFEGLGETLDDAGLLLAAGAHLFGVALVLARVGTEAQCARWLPELASGERLASVAVTEHRSGSNVAAVAGMVEPDPAGLRATGEKCYVTNAERAGLFLFVGRTAEQARGLTAVLVPRETPGVVVGKPLEMAGLRTAGVAPVSFQGCLVSAGAVLGKQGAGMAVFHLAMGFERALLLAFRLGAMRRQLDEALTFAARRTLGEASILEHDAVAHRLARMKRRLETSRLLVYRAAWELDTGERAAGSAALAKWHVAESAAESALDAFALRGAAGCLEESGLPGAIDDALAATIHSGTADVLATVVARSLAPHRQSG
ncbi:MAG: acyl-CoA dehydrogenase [Polyangiaceae bacterium]|nr:acyl-CoA dehydrogenase [Polyangiaceae bacterium]